MKVTIIAPAFLKIKTGKSKKTGKPKFSNALNLNFYRNAHYIFNDKAKKQFKELIKDQIEKSPKFKKIKPKYRYYLRSKADVGNVDSVVSKYFLDAFVELGKIEDDDCFQVIGGDHEFVDIDRENPRCEIEIEELEL